MNITKEVLEIEESLSKRIKSILQFTNNKADIINGNVISIENTNIAYIEPHKLVINDITYLFFNNSQDVYINTLEQSITITEFQNYIKSNKNELLQQCYCEYYKIRL